MYKDKKISFVIPCYKSASTIGFVVEKIYEAFPIAEFNIEIVLVNDGSGDDTFQAIKKLAEDHAEITAINLGKNMGQDAALMCGYNYATGDYIVSLDDDGQNPPIEAHKLLEKIEEGYDAVFGSFMERKYGVFKNLSHRMNDWMARVFVGKPRNIDLSSYFVMNRYLVDEVIKYKGNYPYVWGLMLRASVNVADIKIEHQERMEGGSTYTFGKLLGAWINGFLGFSVKPLRLATILGIATAMLGFILLVIVIISRIIHPDEVEGWTSLVSIIAILGGAQLITVGVVGEYVGRIFSISSNSPQYSVHDVIKR